MPNLVFGHPWTQKPPLGVGLDWNNSLTRGLVVCLAHNAGAGAKMPNLALKTADATISLATWGVTAGGLGLRYDPLAGVTKTSIATHSNFQFGTGDFTVEVRFVARDATSSGALTGRDDSGGTNQRDWVLFANFTAGKISWFSYAGGNIEYASNATNVVAGKVNHCFATRQGTTLTLYSNGVSYGTFTDSANYSANLPLTFGARDSVGSELSFVGSEQLARVWKGRALSAGEVLRLTANPWEMFMPVRPLLPSAAVTFQAAWAKGANRLISGGIWGG